MKPSYISAAELAADESFINWVKNARPEETRQWQNWLHANPGQQQLVAEARQLIQVLSQQEQEKLQAWELEQIWENLDRARQQSPAADEARIIPFRLFRSRIAAAAAGLLALAAGVALYQSYLPEQLTYATAYGEKKTITLPDQSTVILNAHSSLSLPAKWEAGKAREVYLQGEAFFSVKHTAGHQKFRVHTPDEVQVEVLGTEFSVSDRGEHNQVVLASGKVQVSIASQASRQHGKQVVMRPGQLVEISEKTRGITRKEVDPQAYLAWIHNKLVFDNTSLAEIARLLSQDYGYQVVFADKKLAELRLTASFEVTNLNNLLETLAETFNLHIEKQKQKIIISKPSFNQSNNSTTYAK